MKPSVRLGLLVFAVLTTGPAFAANCDRSCLTDLLTQYVDAVVAHEPARVPVAAGVRYTEDSKDLALGESPLWKSVTGKGAFRQDYIDLRRQIAATHVQLQEANGVVLYSVLLRVADHKITGIETLVQRIGPEGRFQPDGSLIKGMPGLKDPVPAGKAMSRAAMVKAALTYTEGLRIGNFTTGKTPFAKEAYRVENGMFIAGVGCPREKCDGLYTQKIMLHPDVKASVAAVDEEQGLVLLWMNFGDTNSYGPGNALITFEAFKVWGGEIHVINAFFRTQAKDTQRGWPGAD
jgi:hypothetical protein